jgi:hypothetical protein
METPAMNRRSLLLGLAAASTAAATGAAVAATVPSENPELIRLGNALPGLVAEYKAARAERSSIVAAWSTRWPRVPDELLNGGCAGPDVERDMTGEAILHPHKWGGNRARGIRTAEELQCCHDFLKDRVRRARTARTRERAAEHLAEYPPLLAIAHRYEARCKRVRDVSGYTRAHQRRQAAERALTETIRDIMATEETSMAGVVIKAQAMAATTELPAWASIIDGGLTWGPKLADAVLRIADSAT